MAPLTLVSPDELSEMKSQFLAGLNHEIRTPLSGILGLTDLLLETNLDAEQREFAAATRQCAESLLDVLNKTLEYSALSANEVTVQNAEFSLRQTIAAAAAEFEPCTREKHLAMALTIAPNLPDTVVGDAFRLRQLLSHLVSNAVKFTNEGAIEISATGEPTAEGTFRLTLSVRDTGIGIADDKLQTIFESFRQLESGLARRYGGLGLGLALARKLTSLLKGDLSVESELGQGSTFAVTVPLSLPRDIHSRKQPAGPDTDPRILVVDDNAVAQMIAMRVLRSQSWQVVGATSGAQALNIVSRGRYDVILMDLQMPEMDGFETAERIRLVPGYRNTPIVALTANESSDYRTLCRDRGMRGFLTKPVQAHDLISAVEQFVAH